MTADGEPATPGELMGRFWGLVNGFTAYFAVLAADELGVFRALADGEPADAGQLAGRCGATAPRLRAVLGGNVAAGTLECRDGAFALTPLAAAHLVRDTPGYLGSLLRQSPGPFENWPSLAVTVRGVSPPRDVEQEGGAFLAALVQATFPVQLAVARAVVARLAADGRLPDGARVLDLGAGAAPWSVAALEHLPAATAVVNDLPAVLPLAEHELATRGLRPRSELLSGSYREVELPAACDLVALGHVCRAEGDEGAAALVARAAAALVPGGVLAIAEYLLDDDLAGPAQAQLLGTTMAASTARGATFTHAEARRWVAAAGLVADGEVVPVPPTTVVLAHRP